MVEVVKATFVAVTWPEDVVAEKPTGEEGAESVFRTPVCESCWFGSVALTAVERGVTVEEDEGTNEIVDVLGVEVPDVLGIGEVDCNPVLIPVDAVAAMDVDTVGTEREAEGMTELELCSIDRLGTDDADVCDCAGVEVRGTDDCVNDEELCTRGVLVGGKGFELG